MNPENLNFFVAFFAGFISFFAPCVVILIPAFLSHLAGVTLTDLKEQKAKYRWPVFINTVFFVIGFTVVFILLGASLGFLSQFATQFSNILSKAGGVIIILFGLVTMGLIDINWLKREHKIKIEKSENIKYFTSFIIGATFAIGWTPCVGPLLAAILLLASTGGSVTTGVLLLLGYSLGLMLPFLVTGAFTGKVAGFLTKHAKFIQYFNYVAGVLLIALGILVFTGTLSKVVGYLYFLGNFGI